ncbi:MAG: transglutaminase family protein [Fimbriimonas sp.]
MLLRLTHRTEYRYPYPARDSHNEVRLMPITDDVQRCEDFRVRVDPPVNVYAYREPGGTVHHFGIRAPHDRLEILVEATVETFLSNPFDGLDLTDANWALYGDPRTAAAYTEFLVASPYVSHHPTARALAEEVRAASNGTLIGFLIDLCHAIHERMDYDPDATHVHSTLDEVVQLKAGVCQDFAHLMLACARSQGIPSRYVSGYLYVGDAAGMRGDQASHAWVECLLPDGRWLALDPTNDLLANDRYIRVHTGCDYSEVAPTRGVYVGVAADVLEVSVRVEQVGMAVA